VASQPLEKVLKTCLQLSNLKGLKPLAMAANGITLARKLPELKECGLTSVNISLDTLVPAKFEFLTRRKGHERVVDSINTAVDCGYNPAKVYIIFAILLVFAFSPNYALFIFNILTRTILLLTAATIGSLLVTYLFTIFRASTDSKLN